MDLTFVLFNPYEKCLVLRKNEFVFISERKELEED